ncbi:MAG: biopolymer transporter ExbD [Verrucomicrobia bacterium]|nr:biopolymer transporter ExbD [Verrucomicrobiota bacterium]NBU07620.1 biopolymer transporter ExbD [Pseudomonadota bacterium]NDA68715.1 biopolymer transporter ExbD [Verrucomicrobiota bacterium]NDB75472.1 biopolymer transporter ExbD [Verrucomicrobiota bacterium]NDD40455.1 biopolymer transporter ExbD [Verrucomicrobiota bacterium]
MAARKKFSKSHHHALAELNITPLLDLAFVLLVIFIITTTPIVNDLDLTLPTASKREKDPPRKANYVTVDGSGKLFLNKKEVDTEALLTELVELRTADPDLSVIVRGDAKTKYHRIVAVLDALQQANVLKVDLATEVYKDPPPQRN